MPPAFGHLLAQHLATAGLSQRAFALRLGLTQAYISKVVHGRRAIPYAGIERWADLLGLAGAARDEFLLAGDLTQTPPRVRQLLDRLLGSGNDRTPAG
jgi:transcriptional regulator with XRE-family HTH domain